MHHTYMIHVSSMLHLRIDSWKTGEGGRKREREICQTSLISQMRFQFGGGCSFENAVSENATCCRSQFSSYILKEVKTEWVQVWANSIRFAIYAVKSKQTYQTSNTITMTWRLEVKHALQFVPVSFHSVFTHFSRQAGSDVIAIVKDRKLWKTNGNLKPHRSIDRSVKNSARKPRQSSMY